jgi:hypothetical protein
MKSLGYNQSKRSRFKRPIHITVEYAKYSNYIFLNKPQRLTLNIKVKEKTYSFDLINQNNPSLRITFCQNLLLLLSSSSTDPVCPTDLPAPCKNVSENGTFTIERLSRDEGYKKSFLHSACLQNHVHQLMTSF